MHCGEKLGGQNFLKSIRIKSVYQKTLLAFSELSKDKKGVHVNML